MTGFVSLVGAGPGDPGLITVAGLERIRRADVVVYDRLAPGALLDHAREGAELVYVGKTPEGQRARGVLALSTDQDTINRTLVERAREGKRVVRLKGGDPFVFGHGGEEAQALRDAAIAFEIVPGVTSAVAVPAYAGIPVTHRGVASSFAVATGHEDPAKSETSIDWEALARVDTLVLLMGVRTLRQIVEKLTAAGRTPETPAAVIQWGTTPEQRTVTGTLSDIVQRVDDAGLAPPAITVVGDVVRMRDSISWFENRPLFGKRVLITRTRKQAGALAQLLAAEGAIPVELPSIEIEPISDDGALAAAIDALASQRYAWTVFTSANAVDIFFDALNARGRDARAFGGTKIAAIGPATAEALAARGIVADTVPKVYVAEGVVEALTANVSPGDRVLIPRAAEARPELPEGLRAIGAEVDEVPLYRAVVPGEAPPEALEALRDGRIDIVTFTSSSTVSNLVSMLDGDIGALTPGPSPVLRERGEDARPLVACIGPITAETARELGLTVDVIAKEYTVPGLVGALKAYVGVKAG